MDPDVWVGVACAITVLDRDRWPSRRERQTPVFLEFQLESRRSAMCRAGADERDGRDFGWLRDTAWSPILQLIRDSVHRQTAHLANALIFLALRPPQVCRASMRPSGGGGNALFVC